ALEPVEVDQRDRAGRVQALGSGQFVIQHSHDAAAVERAGQLVEFGELFDALVGSLELEAAVVQHLAQRAAVEAEERTLSNRKDIAEHRRKAFDRGRDRHRDRRAGEQKDRGQTHRREGPDDGGLPRGHPQRAEFEDQKQHAEKNVADLRRRQQEAELQRDMAANLKGGAIVVLEPFVDLVLGQHDKKSYRPDAGQEIGRGNDDRDRAGETVNQQYQGNQRAAYGLHREHLAALAGTALQHLRG